MMMVHMMMYWTVNRSSLHNVLLWNWWSQATSSPFPTWYVLHSEYCVDCMNKKSDNIGWVGMMLGLLYVFLSLPLIVIIICAQLHRETVSAHTILIYCKRLPIINRKEIQYNIEWLLLFTGNVTRVSGLEGLNPTWQHRQAHVIFS